MPTQEDSTTRKNVSRARRRGVVVSDGRRGFAFIASGDEKFFTHLMDQDNELRSIFASSGSLTGVSVTFVADYNVGQGKHPLAKLVALDKVQTA